MEKITYKGVEILIKEHKHMRSNEQGKDSRPTAQYTYTAETEYGWIDLEDFEEKTSEKSLIKIKAKIDMLDMLIARTDQQLADYLKETFCQGLDGEVVLHPVLMKMVLGNARIPVKPNNTTHEPPDLANKPWWVRIKDWIENWNRKATPNVGQSTTYFR